MRTEIRITGLGGQGAITAGHILGTAAVLYDAKQAVVTEGYSPYITGGWSRADIVVSDDEITYPLVSKLDTLVTMSQDGLTRNVAVVKSNGIILAERKLVNEKSVTDKKCVSIAAAAAAERLGRKMLTNVVLLGSLTAIAPVVSMDALKKAVSKRFPKAAELNFKALEVGFELAKEAMKVGGNNE